MTENWQAMIAICVIYAVVLVPVTIGTVAHIRENKRLFRRWFPASGNPKEGA